MECYSGFEYDPRVVLKIYIKKGWSLVPEFVCVVKFTLSQHSVSNVHDIELKHEMLTMSWYS